MPGFPRKLRLKRRNDFQRVFARRCAASDGRLVLYLCPNGLDVTRLGISASRKVGRAPARNRVKRLIREAFRLQGIGWDQPGYDIVCVARPGPASTLADYERSLRDLLAAACEKLRRQGCGSRNATGA